MKLYVHGMSKRTKSLFKQVVAGIGMTMFASTNIHAAVYQAEDYNNYYDTSPGNSGGAYRSDDVDVEPTSDSGGGFNVGWIDNGEWLVYENLHIPTTGNYIVRMRVASPGGATASVDLNAGQTILKQFNIPDTGGWQNWTTLTATVNISAGTHNLGVYAATSNWNFNWIEIVPENGGTDEPGTPNGTHKRLKVVNGCDKPLWVQWLTAPGVQFNGPNRYRLSGGQSMEYDIPDKGLPSMRFWPGFDCDANGHNCRVGASGGPADLGFTCPPEGCAPPIDSKFEATFGCIPGVNDSDCARNPSAPSQPLGRGDWWNSSMVDGFTVPVKVTVNGYCPVGPQPAPVYGPGGPEGGVIDCSTLRVADCPMNENLSTDGQFPYLSNVDMRTFNPVTGDVAGCYSPAAKLTYSHWANGFQTYHPADPQAQMYTCPTPPISSDQCRSGPADRTAYRDMIHSHCETYAYAYDDGYGLSSCPAATNLSYEVTFYCPQ
ncbi:carbohydrate-binding protein [Hahella sp. CCB-MM4]|uniref:carbohydrate-binding protein n=1 Tax=Hahella sp. (strain CCB-MM4) TaxID=1926491 RepID=UPI000B9A6B69|nr:carbohydrate-binding protein [Hahella sp. CCB-MM4]